MPQKHSGGIEGYPQTYLMCRRRHRWDDGDWREVYDGGKLVGYDEHITCERCGATVVNEYDAGAYPTGQQRRTWPDGYLFAKGEVVGVRLTRLELIKRRTGRVRLRSVPRHTA